MGQKPSAGSTLKRKQIKELMVQTHFGAEEVEALYHHFRSIASSQNDDGFIDRDEFKEAVGLADSLFVDRLFQLFDANDDGKINFPEFLCGLSILSVRGTLEEKMMFSFRIYDFDNDKKISNQELTSMLRTSLLENGVKMTSKQIETIIRATFEEADTNGDGFIDYDEYKKLVAKHPNILSNMTLDMRSRFESKQSSKRGRSSSAFSK